MTQPDANSVLFGSGGAPSVSWTDPATGQDLPLGTIHTGLITKLDSRMQRDMQDKGKIKTWPDGSPMRVALVTILTDQRDPKIEDDDGQRTLWISGKNLTNAVRDAVRSAGARNLEIGGTLSVRLSGYGEPAAQGSRRPRMFEARYQRATNDSRARAMAAVLADPWANGTGGSFDDGEPGQGDPWQQTSANLVGGGQPQYNQGGNWPTPGQTATGDTWGPVQTPAVSPQAAPTASAGTTTPAAAASAPTASTGQGMVTPAGGMIDPATLPPEARAVFERMMAEQQAKAGG